MINVRILTKESTVFESNASRATITTTSGEITVLSGHEPLITTISGGKLVVVTDDSKSMEFAAYYGLAHVENVKGKTNLVVLLESADDVTGNSNIALKEAKAKAKLALKEKDEEFNLNSVVFRNVNRFKQLK